MTHPVPHFHLYHNLQGGEEEKPPAAAAVPNSADGSSGAAGIAPGLASLMQVSKPDQKTVTLDPDGKRLQVGVSLPEFELWRETQIDLSNADRRPHHHPQPRPDRARGAAGTRGRRVGAEEPGHDRQPLPGHQDDEQGRRHAGGQESQGREW